MEDIGRGGGLGQWQKTWSREVVGLAGVTSEGAAKRLSDQHTLTSDPNPPSPSHPPPLSPLPATPGMIRNYYAHQWTPN